MPTDVSRKSTRSAMIMAFPDSARAPEGFGAVWCFIAVTPSDSIPASTLPPPRQRVARQRLRRVHRLGGVEHARGAAQLVVVDHGALVDESPGDVSFVA